MLGLFVSGFWSVPSAFMIQISCLLFARELDQTIFPEIELEKIKRTQGMDITIVTNAPTNEEALDLLKMMGMPFAEAK